MCMLMCKYLKNNSLIACILWNQGYFGHFDYVMCFSCMGGSQVGPIHTLGGASVEITWQEGRLDDKHSGSHPEANLYPEMSVLVLADSLGIRMQFHIRKRIYIRKWTCWRWRIKSCIREWILIQWILIRKWMCSRLRYEVLHPEAKVHQSASARVRLHKYSEMSATFQKSFVQS